MSQNPAGVSAPAWQFQTRAEQDSIVVQCRGRMTFEVTQGFKAEIKQVIQQTKRIVIDLTGVEFMDSSGLGAVASLYVSAKKAGCEFHLINFNKQIRELLGITHLLDAFETCGKHISRF